MAPGKKGTRDAYKKWNLQDRAWVDMRLHESHNEGLRRPQQHYLKARRGVCDKR